MARSAGSQHGLKQLPEHTGLHWGLRSKAENPWRTPQKLVFTDLTQSFALRSS